MPLRDCKLSPIDKFEKLRLRYHPVRQKCLPGHCLCLESSYKKICTKCRLSYQTGRVSCPHQVRFLLHNAGAGQRTDGRPSGTLSNRPCGGVDAQLGYVLPVWCVFGRVLASLLQYVPLVPCWRRLTAAGAAAIGAFASMWQDLFMDSLCLGGIFSPSNATPLH